MPVIIRDLDDDAATVLMVDTNIQRENLLPSEKARAYKMKYEALKHQGSKGDKHTADAVGEKAGDSGRTVQRYIRLASLIDGLLDLVDTGKIAMIAGERLSYLKLEEQEMVMGAAENTGVYPSPAQAGQLKVMSEEGMLSEGSIYALLVKKEGGGQTVTISSKKIRDVYGNNIHIFENCIPMSVRAVETTAEGKSIYLHDPKGIVAEGYRHLTGEVLADEK